MASQFPSINSQQRAGQFNKIPLKPGRSLVNWIQLTKSGRDLRKTGGSFLSVTPEELAKHNKPNDAWMSIRGMVYNVSDYMEYHPGGMDELMKGVGKDATTLFDEVHRWVNYQNMLRECLIGKMVPSQMMKAETTTRGKPSLTPSSAFLSPNMSTLSSLPSLSKKSNMPKSLPTTGLQGPVIKITSEEEARPMKPDWFDSYETETTAVLVIYTKDKTISNKNAVCDIINSSKIIMNIVSGTQAMCVRLQFLFNVTDDIDVKVGANGKMEIVFYKVSLSKQSPIPFKPLDDHGDVVNIEDEEKLTFRTCKLKSVQKINHDTSFYTFSLPNNSHMHLPIGCHVFIKFNVDGTTILRPYTAVLNSFETKEENSFQKELHFIIKHYENGTITPLIKALTEGQSCEISSYSGKMDTETVLKEQDSGSILLLAAGTGITPMVKVIQYLLNSKKNVKVFLVFFNKTAEDILWKEKFDDLCKNYPDQFIFNNILSQPDTTWNGQQGRISHELIGNIYLKYALEEPLCFVCGPIRFTQFTKDIFTSKKGKLFIFS